MFKVYVVALVSKNLASVPSAIVYVVERISNEYFDRVLSRHKHIIHYFKIFRDKPLFQTLISEEYVPAGLGESAYGGRVMLPETMRKTYEKQYVKNAWILFRHGGYGFISDDALALSEDGEYYIVSEAASAQVKDIGELPTDECAKIIDHPEPTRVEGLLESYACDAIVERVRNGYVPHFDRRPW